MFTHTYIQQSALQQQLDTLCFLCDTSCRWQKFVAACRKLITDSRHYTFTPHYGALSLSPQSVHW